MLLANPACGQLGPPTSLSEQLAYTVPYTSKMLQRSASYAKQCYTPESSNLELDCDTFVKTALNTSVVTNASCPFGGGICRSNASNLMLDTGYLDSNNDLGLNAPPNDWFRLRMVIRCAPISTEGYTTTSNTSSTRSFTRYFYGPRVYAGTAAQNFTRSFSNDVVNDAAKAGINPPAADYSLSVEAAFYHNRTLRPDSTFAPVPELQRPDADVHLIFLAPTTVLFSSRIEDPLFRATTPAGNISSLGQGGTLQYQQVFRPDAPALPMACTEQFQFCNGPESPDKCSPLAAIQDALDFLYAKLVSDDSDNSTRHRFDWALSAPTGPAAVRLKEVVQILQAQALLATDSLYLGMQGPLPGDQWQLEVQHWHMASLAHLQAIFVLAATGPGDRELERFVVSPNNTVETLFCNSQVKPTHPSLPSNILIPIQSH